MSIPNLTNRVFERALQKHIDLWKSDKRLFSEISTPDDVLKEVENMEKKHRNTRVRRYTARFSTVVQGFHSYFTAVDAFVSSNPQVVALVWGGLRFIIQVCCRVSLCRILN